MLRCRVLTEQARQVVVVRRAAEWGIVKETIIQTSRPAREASFKVFPVEQELVAARVAVEVWAKVATEGMAAGTPTGKGWQKLA